MADREYCYKEQAFFPSAEFYDDPKVGRVHRAGRPHTVTGDAVELQGSDAKEGRLVELVKFLFAGLNQWF